MALEVNFRLNAGLRYDDEVGVYVTWCPALDVRSQGGTEVEAKRALLSAIKLYLTHCYKRSILDDLLNKRGFRMSEGVGQDDGISDDEIIQIREYKHTFTVDVPFNLSKGAIRGDLCPDGLLLYPCGQERSGSPCCVGSGGGPHGADR